MTHIADNLTHKELELLHAHGTRVTVPQGWSLMWERTPADKTYLIVAGEVAIRRNNVEVARLGPGDVGGEMSVVHQKLRTATVVAATPLAINHCTAEAVTDLCERHHARPEGLPATAKQRTAPAEPPHPPPPCHTP